MFAPQDMGIKDVLVGGTKILKIGDNLPAEEAYGVEVIDGTGKILMPGLIGRPRSYPGRRRRGRLQNQDAGADAFRRSGRRRDHHCGVSRHRRHHQNHDESYRQGQGTGGGGNLQRIFIRVPTRFLYGTLT